MKRFLAITACAWMLASVLCACSGTATISDLPSGYGNVSTTENGTVNGTNDYLNGTGRTSGSGYTTDDNTAGTHSSTNSANSNNSGRNMTGTGMSSASGMAADR